MSMHGLQQKAIIAAKRARREAKRAAALASTTLPTQDAQPSITGELQAAWEQFKALDGAHWLWRVHRLWERHQRDMEDKQYHEVKKSRHGDTHIYRPYHEWDAYDLKWLRTVVAPRKTKIQDTKFHDIKRWVKSPARKGGTRAEPRFDWVVLMFGGGGGQGPAREVTSLCVQVEATTPEQLLAWFNTFLPKLEKEIPACVKGIESRHGGPKKQHDVKNKHIERLNAAKREKRLKKLVGVETSVRVKQNFRGDMESNVGDMRMPKRVLLRPLRPLSKY